MPRKRAPKPTTTIRRGSGASDAPKPPVIPGLPVVPPYAFPPVEPENPLTDDELAKRSLAVAIVHAQVGSVEKTAEIFGITVATVRWYFHKLREKRPDELQRIADRLQGNVAQLAVDRIQEGLLEGETMEAAALGVKLLHGLGQLRSHSAIKNDGPNTVNNLTVNYVKGDRDVGPVAEGAVLGKPYALDGEVAADPDDEDETQPSAKAS